MKILHLMASADLKHGGPIEHALRLGEALAQRGHSQVFMTIDSPGTPAIADVPATVIARGPALVKGGGLLGRLRRWMNYAPDAVPWLRRHAVDYDVVIVSGLWNYMAMAARRALPGARTPYLVFPHGMLDPWFKRTYPAKAMVKQLLWFISEGPLLRHAHFVLFACDEERRLARQSFRPYRARERVVTFGTAGASGDAGQQQALFRASMPALGQRRYLLFLSRIHEKKGVDLLVDAFAAVAADQPELDLVIAGPDQQGLRAGLERRAAELGCAARIHWPGMLRGDLKWGALHGCDAFVLPSHQENFGIVVAEALACSRPVLISDKVNIWREIEADRAGLVEPDTPAGTERLLRRWLALDEGERAAMRVRAAAGFASRFDVERAADEFERLLTEVVDAAAERSTHVAA